MFTCKQKIQASPDQIFNYLSDLQNVIDLYKSQFNIETIKDLGSACYGKQYRYIVANKNRANSKNQPFTVEITQYEPFESIAWSVKSETELKERKNTINIPTTILANCEIIPEQDYTLVKIALDYEMQAALWIKVLFTMIMFFMKSKACVLLKDIRNDIERNYAYTN